MPLEAAEVNSYLRARHVAVFDEWTDQCLAFLRQAHEGVNVTSDEMKEDVYYQWLDSDLAEIAPPVLPQGFTKQRKTQLTGNYALQINAVKDASVPAYGQLLKIQGKENENALVSATQSTQQTQNKFEQKSNRMLILHLTDGHLHFEGMEYQPITDLSVDTLPGTKILVHGSIQCRLGVLMLTADNVKVLGGEVESLMETNSKIQVLSNALGIDGSQETQQASSTTANQQQPAPECIIDLTTDIDDENVTNDNMSRNQGSGVNRAGSGVNRAESGVNRAESGVSRAASGVNRAASGVNRAGSGVNRTTSGVNRAAAGVNREASGVNRTGSGVNRAASGAEEAFFSDDLGDDLDALILDELQRIEEKDQLQQKAKKAEEDPVWPDDEDEIDELLLQEVELTYGAHVPPQPVQNAQIKPRTANEYSKPSSSLQDAEDNREQSVIAMGPSVSRTNLTRTGFSSRDNPSNETTKHSSINQENLNTEKKHDMKDTASHGQTSCSSRQDNLGKQDLQGANKITSTVKFGTDDRSGGHNSNPDVQPRSLQVIKPGHLRGMSVIPIRRSGSKPECKKLTEGPWSKMMAPGLPRNLSVIPMPRSTKPAQVAAGSAEQTTKDSLQNVTSTPSTSSTDEQNQSSGVVDTKNQDDDIIAAKRQRFHSSEGVGSGSASLETSSVVKLSSVINRIESKEEFTFTIKGFIVTLMSPLDRKDGYWSITAKISDKTAKLDVDLSNEVLTGLIGFSVPEMMNLRNVFKTSDASKAKEVETKLREGLAQCQKSLMEMHSTMNIEVNPSQQRPLVTSVGTTDPSDVATLFREVPNKSK